MQMTISNDTEFKLALEQLNVVQQRQVAAMFVTHVLALSDDNRLDRVIKVAADADATAEELSGALKTAHSATFDSHARCGAEGNWQDQAGYFVARAAVAATTAPEHSRAGGPAWQAAMSARMAYTSMLIDKVDGDESAHAEAEWQYQSLSDYLKA
jgi:hypothetical protein